MITVIIPYFQREAGVLRRSLHSIATQKDCPLPIHTIVVDDSSPVPAQDEVMAAGSLPGTLEIIRQPNGGPGSARNTGLDRAPKETRYIAFLDSDDEWSDDHLARAVLALRQGYDFYFADLYQLGQTIGAFARAGQLNPAKHPLLPGTSELHEYQGDMFDQIICGNVIGTPTVVYGFKRFPKLRFRVEFTHAGEDYLFWMAVAHENAKIAFSSAVEVTCGKGVNVYSGSGWGTEQHLRRLHNEIKFRKTISRMFPVTTRQKAHIDDGVRKLREAVGLELLHRLSHRRRTPLKLLWSHLTVDPLSYVLVPALAARMLLKRD